MIAGGTRGSRAIVLPRLGRSRARTPLVRHAFGRARRPGGASTASRFASTLGFSSPLVITALLLLLLLLLLLALLRLRLQLLARFTRFVVFLGGLVARFGQTARRFGAARLGVGRSRHDAARFHRLLVTVRRRVLRRRCLWTLPAAR